MSGGACGGGGSSSHKVVCTSVKGMLVDVVEGDGGLRSYAAWRWCVVLVVRVRLLDERGALVVV